MKKYPFIIFVLILSICCCDSKDESAYIISPISEDFSSIENPLDRWNAYNLSDYVIHESRSCECFPPNSFTTYVLDNEVADVEYELAEGNYYNRTENEIYNYAKNVAITVIEAFSIIENHKESAHRIEIEYDARFGFPVNMYIDIDSLIADEEISRSFNNLQKIVK